MRWAESVWGDRMTSVTICQLTMTSGRTAMLREKLEEEVPRGNPEKNASEKAGVRTERREKKTDSCGPPVRDDEIKAVSGDDSF